MVIIIMSTVATKKNTAPVSRVVALVKKQKQEKHDLLTRTVTDIPPHHPLH